MGYSVACRPDDVSEVGAFVDSVYGPLYDACPLPADAYAALGWQSELVACIGLEWEGARRPLRDRAGVSPGSGDPASPRGRRSVGALGLDRAASGEISRVRRHGVRPCPAVLVEHDETVHRHCLRLGMVLHEGVARR